MATAKNEPNNWIIRIQDGKHFFANADNGVWAIRSGVSRYNNILRLFKKGDNIWFMQNKASTGTSGLLKAYAKYETHNERNPDKILMENNQRGWNSHMPIFGGNWGIEIKFTHYKDLRGLDDFNTYINNPNPDAIMPRIIFDNNVNFNHFIERFE